MCFVSVQKDERIDPQRGLVDFTFLEFFYNKCFGVCGKWEATRHFTHRTKRGGIKIYTSSRFSVVLALSGPSRPIQWNATIQQQREQPRGPATVPK